MTAMDLTIHATFLPHNDPDASLAFYRDSEPADASRFLTGLVTCFATHDGIPAVARASWRR